jgi:hypothetical protein
MIEFIHYIEIPIRVFAEYQPEERATMTYPRYPAAMGIEYIEICLPSQDETPVKDLEELENYISLGFNDEFVHSAWDHKD